MNENEQIFNGVIEYIINDTKNSLLFNDTKFTYKTYLFPQAGINRKYQFIGTLSQKLMMPESQKCLNFGNKMYARHITYSDNLQCVKITEYHNEIQNKEL